MQLELFNGKETKITGEVALVEIFESYLQCRKNKRYTANAIAFEIDYEHNLINLWREINAGTYKPNRSIAFIIDQAVKREIFAADFRDRVVHHYIIKKLNPLFEKQFIIDSYACRVGKGTHFGIQRINRFIRKCSQNYSEDCFILKLDIKGFFMHIDRSILYAGLKEFITQKYNGDDKIKLLELVKINVFNDPTDNCIKKSSAKKWKGLPQSKSLFHSPSGSGLPIGNLTSQIFANFYMDKFDHFIKHNLGIKYYGRYVDDFVIVHEDKEYLKRLIGIIKIFLKVELRLDIHPKKIYLQHYTKGVSFLGTFIKPNRIYIGKRTKGNFYKAILRQNEITKKYKPTIEEQVKFQSSMNSYLGIMKHYNTYKLRKKMIWKYLRSYWWNVVYLSGGYAKLVRKVRRSTASNT
ncbi:MAG: hypothetical protein RLZZ248_1248 [Bacteroidota bacterium]